jgi:hypothetical protein
MHKEIDFENDIEQALISIGGYGKGEPTSYDQGHGGLGQEQDRNNT